MIRSVSFLNMVKLSLSETLIKINFNSNPYPKRGSIIFYLRLYILKCNLRDSNVIQSHAKLHLIFYISTVRSIMNVLGCKVRFYYDLVVKVRNGPKSAF